MKKIFTLLTVAALCLLSACDHPVDQASFVLQVDGIGVIANDTIINITDAEETLFGTVEMECKGSIIAVDGLKDLSVTIARPAGCEDQFCVASSCIGSNGETLQECHFDVDGTTDWYAHFQPTDLGTTTIVYCFKGGQRALNLVVNYNYASLID